MFVKKIKLHACPLHLSEINSFLELFVIRNIGRTLTLRSRRLEGCTSPRYDGEMKRR